ncbi:MAG: MinD/ParA family protein [Anaerolineales bacterium]|nr:MinD/ParA family protein [Anaerolineales bacterium]MCB8953042.1 MinD/ParA family protein [Ardenticatenales bacterium]
MTLIISLHSFRGGTGKSNVTANTATMLVQQGYRVGVFDTDIQSPGIHVIFNLPEDKVKFTLNDYLWGHCAIEDAAYTVDLPGATGNGQLYLVPSSIKANDIARVLRDRYDANALNDGFRDLIAALNLDYLLIDTHPGLNEETLLSIAISDILVVVLRPDQQDFQGTHVTVDVARRLKVPDIFLVVNKVPPDYDFEDVKRKVEHAYNAPVATLLPLSLDVAHVASSQVFCLQDPQHAFSRGVRELVGCLVQA